MNAQHPITTMTDLAYVIAGHGITSVEPAVLAAATALDHSPSTLVALLVDTSQSPAIRERAFGRLMASVDPDVAIPSIDLDSAHWEPRVTTSV